jgi:hypothetical protein
MALLLGSAALGSEQDLTATEFRSNGDLYSGWYWLRDQVLQQYAEWAFEGIPTGTEDLTLEITALATNRGSGGRGYPAEFRLIYGFPGSGKMGGVFDTKVVTLPNVSPPNDPLGYTCRGVVTISRSAFPAASALVFRVERTSPDANHVAFNKESIVILAPGAEHESEHQNDAGSGQDASDERQGAWHLGPGTYHGFLKDNDDYDWYSFEADKGQIISLKLVPQTGDFDLYLYKSDSGSSVAHSNHGTGQEEAIQYVAGQSGPWYIKVKRSSGEGEYDLTIEVQNQNDAGSGQDASDERQGAWPLKPGTYSGFLKRADDYDWYEIKLMEGQSLSVDLTVPQAADFDLYLYKSDSGSSVAHSNHGTGQEEAIQYVAGQSGTWYIRVKRNSGEGEYTLTVAPPSHQASEFNSTGDLIDTWSWLRDDALQQSAEWTFEGIAPTAPILTVEITLLASSIVTGLTEVHFLLIVGPPGAATSWSQEVSLPVVGPAAGAAEFRCRGIVQIPRLLQYGTDQSNLIFRVQRVSPDAPRIAFREDSVTVQTVQEETALEAELRTVTADGFEANGDSILGTVWCRKAGHALEWIWGPLNEGGTIVEAAVNFSLLVTNTFDGGSGFSAVVPVTVFDLTGEVVELGILELTNTFRPKFSGDTGGIGYAASGTYELKDSDLILNGFRLRLTWPAIAPLDGEETAGTPRHFGGNRESALLAYIVGSSAQNAPTPLQVSLSNLLNDPELYVGKTINLEAEFYGWAGGLTACPPPLTRSDWLIGGDGGYLYVTGPFPPGLSPWETLDYGERVSLSGTVRIKRDTPDLVCPYIELQSVEVMEDQEK